MPNFPRKRRRTLARLSSVMTFSIEALVLNLKVPNMHILSTVLRTFFKAPTR